MSSRVLTQAQIDQARIDAREIFRKGPRHAREGQMYRDMASGRTMEECTAVTDDVDRAYWRRHEPAVKAALARHEIIDMEGMFDGLD